MEVAARKHVLFFSNYCRHCRDVMSMIMKRNMRGAFVAVCVDTDRSNLPGFVDRVPLVLTAEDRRVLADEELVRFLNAADEPTADPLAAGDFWRGGASEGFAFLVGEQAAPELRPSPSHPNHQSDQERPEWQASPEGGKGFMMLGTAEDNYGFPRIYAPNDDEPANGAGAGPVATPPVPGRRGSAPPTMDLDAMRRERDSDIERLLRTQARPLDGR